MKLLIKLGGSLLDTVDSRNRIAAQLAQVSSLHDTIVVHGGGKQVTRFLESQGLRSRFINGLRVSDAPVIDAVTKVIAGTVNKALVAAIHAAGKRAVGLSGLDGLLTEAVQLSPELEFAGRPTRTNIRLPELLIRSGYLPVIACLAGDSQGAIYNVNADQMAVSCATAWRADTLIFLTDVPGVKSQSGDVIPKLNTSQVRELIHNGVAHGGMQAKLEAATLALESGVDTVIVASGDEPEVCPRLISGEMIGTQIAASAAMARNS